MPAPLAVCCHDAGGANLIASWLATEWEGECRLCVAGPARDIFARVLPGLEPMPMSRALDAAAGLLCGSGWASDLEHDARLAARRASIPSWAVLDHWVNYPMRFTRHGTQCLPDAFVVTDAQAAEIAAENFGDTRPILTWRNRYLEKEVASVHGSAKRNAVSPPRRLLVVLEPVREDWSPGASVPAEYRALDYLMNKLAVVTSKPAELEIRLRPHPSEAPSKYEQWIDRQQRAGLEISTGASLAEDIAWADVVAGLQSYALVVALEAGRRAISYLPPDAPVCALRHPRLERLAQ